MGPTDDDERFDEDDLDQGDEIFDSFDEDLEDDWVERSRARRARSAWVLVGAAAAVLGMTAGFLAIDRDGGDEEIPVPVTAPDVPASTSVTTTVPPTTAEAPTVEALTTENPTDAVGTNAEKASG